MTVGKVSCPLCGGPDAAQCRCTAACFMCGREHETGTPCPERSECERYGHIFYVPGRAAKTCQRVGCGVINPNIREATT
jgi:hypothetical protein